MGVFLRDEQHSHEEGDNDVVDGEHVDGSREHRVHRVERLVRRVRIPIVNGHTSIRICDLDRLYFPSMTENKRRTS